MKTKGNPWFCCVFKGPNKIIILEKGIEVSDIEFIASKTIENMEDFGILTKMHALKN